MGSLWLHCLSRGCSRASGNILKLSSQADFRPCSCTLQPHGIPPHQLPSHLLDTRWPWPCWERGSRRRGQKDSRRWVHIHIPALPGWEAALFPWQRAEPQQQQQRGRSPLSAGCGGRALRRQILLPLPAAAGAGSDPAVLPGAPQIRAGSFPARRVPGSSRQIQMRRLSTVTEPAPLRAVRLQTLRTALQGIEFSALEAGNDQQQRAARGSKRRQFSLRPGSSLARSQAASIALDLLPNATCKQSRLRLVGQVVPCKPLFHGTVLAVLPNKDKPELLSMES